MAVQQKKSEESPQSKKERGQAYLQKHLCSFRTGGRRCQVIGSISNGTIGEIKERWCGWHWLGLSHLESLQNFNDYKKFREDERDNYPPEWLQASLYIDDEISWQAILGKITHAEHDRYVIAKENEFDKEKLKSSGLKNPIETVAKSFEEDLPF